MTQKGHLDVDVLVEVSSRMIVMVAGRGWPRELMTCTPL